MKLSNLIKPLINIKPEHRVMRIQAIFIRLENNNEIFFPYKRLYRILNTHVAKVLVQRKRKIKLNNEDVITTN